MSSHEEDIQKLNQQLKEVQAKLESADARAISAERRAEKVEAESKQDTQIARDRAEAAEKRAEKLHAQLLKSEERVAALEQHQHEIDTDKTLDTPMGSPTAETLVELTKDLGTDELVNMIELVDEAEMKYAAGEFHNTPELSREIIESDLEPNMKVKLLEFKIPAEDKRAILKLAKGQETNPSRMPRSLGSEKPQAPKMSGDGRKAMRKQNLAAAKKLPDKKLEIKKKQQKPPEPPKPPGNKIKP